MVLKQSFANYTSPIIAVDREGFVVAKNYIAEISFEVIHVGALASKYTDIDFTKETLSKGQFCGKEYTYFTLFDSIDDTEVTLLFLSLATFGEDLLPFNVLELYREKVNALDATDEADKNHERKYIRSVHNNLVKANYFQAFSKIFDAKLEKRKIKIENERVVLSKICYAIKTAVESYLENIDITVDIDYDTTPLIASICETDISCIILNSLSFCVINSLDSVKISLIDKNDYAELSFCFNSNISFDRWLDSTDNSVLNSSLSLLIAFELAEVYGFKYSLTRSGDKKTSNNALVYKIPIERINFASFASKDTITNTVEKFLLSIFYDVKY